MSAPSSPVPAVERIELPGGWYFQQLNPPHGLLYALRSPSHKGFGINGTGMSVGLPVVQAFAAAMSPTPGRAAEPDTMGEVEKLLSVALDASFETGDHRVVGEPEEDDDWRAKKRAVDQAERALLSAVRTIVTERDEWKANYEGLFESIDGGAAEFRTRAETAEAQLATLRAEVEGKGLIDDDVEWVVNDLAELGVKIKDRFFFCYKGESLVYVDAKHDDSDAPMKWRRVFKREFGECIHPINYDDPCLVGSVSLDDSEGWQDLPAMPEHTSSYYRTFSTSGADR